jgi:hypothetical protein
METNLLSQMRTAIPDVEILDIGAVQCTPACDVIDGDQLLYFDAFHFTSSGAKWVGARLRESFDLIGFINSRSSHQP